MPDRSRKGHSDAAPRPAPGKEVSDAQAETARVARDKDPSAVALGRKGGLKGGRVRAAKLTPERRSEIARKAAAARWNRTT